MKNFSPYTDLALEIAENIIQNNNNSIDGIEIITKDASLNDTNVTIVNINNENGANEMGRPIGSYITIESSAIKTNDKLAHEELIKLLSDELAALINPAKLSSDKPILIIGLGNKAVTPDSLGPKVIDDILVTRHIKSTLPGSIKDKVRNVAAIAPGVMGVTGIETLEVVKGITDSIKPQLIIAIDALAARKVSRINSTIQICNTGVAPGGGVGNKRATLNKSSLGTTVIAIGVPTVVDAATLANDTIDKLLCSMLSSVNDDSPLLDTLKDMQAEDRYQLILELLDPYSENMFVTPKEVDAVIDNIVNIIANALNIMLHPGIEKDDINRFKS